MSIIRSILSVTLLVTLANAGPILKNELNTIIRAETSAYRLPETAIPTAYTITLTPELVPDVFTFKGESVIEITTTGAKKQIKLHAKDLEIDKDKVTLVEVKETAAKTYKPTISIDNVTDFLTLDFSVEIPDGNYKLNLEYTGKLHADMYGFYRSSYENERGEKVYLATTQFEPTHARRAFPCFDEPALKATFKITIIHEDKYHVRSNTLEESSSLVEGSPTKKKTTFKVTPKMSTYLVAFIVSDFESKTSTDGKFRVWSQRNAIHNGVYALTVGEEELKALEEYTGISIPKEIGKMDNFAIPDFASGAMENWGIVTYREKSLLFEEGVSTTAAKQSIATVISHEFAHQWFGNLVSPLWWEYTWLNEGFANYLQYVITDKVETKWRLMEQFVLENIQSSAFVADDDVNQHPMNVKVETPVQIKKIFDRISYQKAGSVIRMISHALTEKLFKKGLTAYLKTLNYGAATSEDLFNALAVNAPDAAGDLKLNAVLDTWAKQAGYPVITVTFDTVNKKAKIVQKRFLSKTPATPREELWYIPITYATQGDPNFDVTKPDAWLKNVQLQEIELTGLKEKEWVIFNKQQTGYYRVNYDATNWQLIIAAMDSDNYKLIPEVNRAQLLDDSFNLAQAKELDDYKVFLGLSRYLERDVSYVPWHAAFRAFSVLNKALANTDKYDLFKLYVLKLSSTLENHLNYTEVEDEYHMTKFNRINLINWACLFGSKQCRDATFEKVYNHLHASEKISPDLRGVAFCAGLRDADEEVWNKALEYYKSSKDAAERSAILNGLGCSSDTNILKSYLEKTIEPNETLSLQTALTTVSASSASGINVAFDFIIENYDTIYELDNNQTTTIVKSLKEIASRLTTKEQVDKLKALTTDRTDIAEDLKESTAQAEANVEWVKTNQEHIKSFLDAQQLVDPPKEEEKKDVPDSSPTMSLPAISFTILLALGARFVSFVH